MFEILQIFNECLISIYIVIRLGDMHRITWPNITNLAVLDACGIFAKSKILPYLNSYFNISLVK